MKNFIVPFMAVTLFMVSDANAQCVGGYGTGFGFNSNSCDFASSLWTDYCNGGPAMPPSPSRGCGCSMLGGGCGSGGGLGCGGGSGIMSHIHGLLGRLGSRGCGGCGSSCAPTCAPACGPSWGAYNYPGYTIQGFGAYAGTVPYFGNAGCGTTWWYGGGTFGRPARCGNRGCRVGHSGCRHRHHCGRGLGLFSHFRNRLSYSSWIGGGPLDNYSLVAGYGGFVGSQLDYGCINGACSGNFGVPMPAGSCGCDGATNTVVQYGGQVSSGVATDQSYSAGQSYESQSYTGTVEEYAPVEELPIEEGPFYESNPIGSDSEAVEEIPAGDEDN